jgi:hypothetical protein
VPFVGLTCYSIFANSPFGLTLVYRALNFLLIPLFLLVAIGFWRLTDKEFRWKRSFKLGLGGALAIFLFLNCFVVFASVSLRDPYLGYFWLYHEPEMDASEWVASYASNVSVAGDVKVSYLLDYFDVPVDVFGGLRYLESDGSPPSLMVIYSEMETNGYVVYGGYPLALSGNWTNKLDDLNCVYSNGMVNVYAK